MKILGGKWSLLILWNIQDAPQRFWELRKLIPDISEKMLIQTLKQLEEGKYILRKDYKTIPPKVEYSLIKKWYIALSLCDILEKLEEEVEG